MTTQELDVLITDLSKDFAPIVKKIESGLKITKDHYGKYMSLISMLCKGDDVTGKVYALALIKAGANRNGVVAATVILFP